MTPPGPETLTLFTLSAVTIAATGAGIAAASRAMYLPDRDLPAILVVLAAGATISLLTAALLGRRITASRRRTQARESTRRELLAWISEDLRAPIASLRHTATDLPEAHHLLPDVDRLLALAEDLREISR
jgi:K+-sensing histidine kinase KdpD